MKRDPHFVAFTISINIRVGKKAVSFTKNKFCFILNAINNSEDLLWQKKMFNM